MLRRRKADVAAQLPAKTEQVLFCTLNSVQVKLYRAFLESREAEQILAGDRHALQVGLHYSALSFMPQASPLQQR